MTTYKVQTASGHVYVLQRERGVWHLKGGEGREGVIVALGSRRSEKGFPDLTDDMMREVDGEVIVFQQEVLTKYVKPVRTSRIAHCWRTRWLFGDKQLY